MGQYTRWSTATRETAVDTSDNYDNDDDDKALEDETYQAQSLSRWWQTATTGSLPTEARLSAAQTPSASHDMVDNDDNDDDNKAHAEV